MRVGVSVLLLLLLLLLSANADAKKKKKKKRRSDYGGTASLPSEWAAGCPFHRDEAEAQELSEFGHELERDGRQSEALRCYAKATRSSPNDAIGWYDLAVARQYADPKAAIRYYRQGLSLKPTDHASYNQLGVLLRTNDQQEEAVRHFRVASRLRPTDADAFFHLGGSNDALERHGEVSAEPTRPTQHRRARATATLSRRSCAFTPALHASAARSAPSAAPSVGRRSGRTGARWRWRTRTRLGSTTTSATCSARWTAGATQ